MFFFNCRLSCALMALLLFRWAPPRLEANTECIGFLGFGSATTMVVLSRFMKCSVVVECDDDACHG